MDLVAYRARPFAGIALGGKHSSTYKKQPVKMPFLSGRY